jgi:hypothetical protein
VAKTQAGFNEAKANAQPPPQGPFRGAPVRLILIATPNCYYPAVIVITPAD